VPTGSVHIDAALSNLSISYSNGNNIMRKVFLPFPVTHKSDVVYKYGQEIFLAEDDARAAGAEANSSTWALTTVGFSCGGHALKDKIARDKENNADPALNLIADSTTILTAKGSLNEEIAGVAKLVAMMTGAQVADQAGTAWSSPDVDPYKILRQAIDTITLTSGRAPNALALAGPVWTAIRVNPNVVGLVTGAPQITNAKVTQAQFAELLELDEVIVGRTVYNTVAGATKTWVWGQKALLFYRPPNPGLRTLALGYTPVWTNALAAVTGLAKIPGMDGQGDQFVQQYFWEPEVSDYVVVHRYYDQMSVAPECGILFTGCLGTANA
jgi:hypothetical protein